LVALQGPQRVIQCADRIRVCGGQQVLLPRHMKAAMETIPAIQDDVYLGGGF
jgi:hypothetical protein